MKDVMIDFETLGLAIDCPLAAAAFLVFESDATEFTIHESFYSRILFDNDKNPAHMEASTLWWWMQKSDEARLRTFDPAGAYPIDYVLNNMCNLISQHNPDRVWSKGVDFDIAILKWRCEQLGMTVPWHYRKQMCYRTLENLYPHLKIAEDKKPHTADEDAYAQAERVWWHFGRGLNSATNIPGDQA